MRKRIKNSLSAKVFLWVFSTLTICCILVYGIIFALLPSQFDVRMYNEMEENVTQLTNKIDGRPIYSAYDEIEEFCRSNNASVTLSGLGETRTFGEINMEYESDSVIGTSITANVYFIDMNAEYELTINYLSRAAHIVTNVMLWLLPVVIAGILLLSLLSAFICSKVIVSPIKKISVISKKMTALDPTWKCDVDRSDEIGVLSESLNTMASRLQQAMQELTDANERLKQDIERRKELEQQRRNFFIAVSHELKTPLTILKGQIENMILGYGDYADHEKYLPQAFDSAERIEQLVREIIAITKTENTDISGSLCEVSLAETVSETVETIAPLAEEKHISIHNNMQGDITLTVDRKLWSKALSNVIGNAVRHSPEGAEVFITLGTADDKQALTVTNTGASIPEEDLPHMFTPFYRADKSRNRATGGSGLGLYIVKTILDLHGMTCAVENTQQGVAFHIYLK